eukprot:scaffold309092_cov32-Tisochrysis_lutea.AAC.2
MPYEENQHSKPKYFSIRRLRAVVSGRERSAVLGRGAWVVVPTLYQLSMRSTSPLREERPAILDLPGRPAVGYGHVLVVLGACFANATLGAYKVVSMWRSCSCEMDVCVLCVDLVVSRRARSGWSMVICGCRGATIHDAGSWGRVTFLERIKKKSCDRRGREGGTCVKSSFTARTPPHTLQGRPATLHPSHSGTPPRRAQPDFIYTHSPHFHLGRV